MPQAPSRAIRLFGTEEAPAATRTLRAGPLTAELDAGNLRYIRFGGREAIRAISFVVRDPFWGTYGPDIRDLRVEETAERFSVTYRACCRDDNQSLTYHARITGEADGRLRFEGEGAADSDFLTNRTGFVVLHGIEGVSGEPVTVEEIDGRTIETRFPEIIDPKQPIMNIRALTHRVAPGLEVSCTMLGDTFEMEDQRNWTDASYKTYVRPLDLPFPYTLKAGETLAQAVELQFRGTLPATASEADGHAIRVDVGAVEGVVPSIGMALEWQNVDAALARLDALEMLRPAFLSGYFDARHADSAALRGFATVAAHLACPLALELVLPDLNESASSLGQIAATLADAGVTPSAVAVSPGDDLNFVMPGTEFADMAPYQRLYEAAHRAFPESRIGGGTFVYFTELNRKPPPLDALDYVTHSTCAIVHAADDRSVTETIECLPAVIHSARVLMGDRSYCLGPVGIGTRTSPFGGEPAANAHSNRVAMCRNDPRQRGLLGASWHLGAAARAAAGNVDSLVLGAPTGDFGLVHHPGCNPQPWFDENGGWFPVFHIMAGLYRASGQPRRGCRISRPRDLQALAVGSSTSLELWLGNLTGETLEVTLSGIASQNLRVALLDDESFAACAADPRALDSCESTRNATPLTLRPYAVARCRSDR